VIVIRFVLVFLVAALLIGVPPWRSNCFLAGQIDVATGDAKEGVVE
jgi:hypothetical protein